VATGSAPRGGRRPAPVYPTHDGAVPCAGLLNSLYRSDLVGPGTLVLIKQEHGHSGGAHQFVGLGDARTVVRWHEPVAGHNGPPLGC
jgi:hypothetical protein